MDRDGLPFISSEHRRCFAALLDRDGASSCDMERMSLFFILSGNESLMRNACAIYDFSEHRLGNGVKHLCRMPSSSNALLTLGINLYNGLCVGDADPAHIFRTLDKDNVALAIRAIQIRFMCR